MWLWAHSGHRAQEELGQGPQPLLSPLASLWRAGATSALEGENECFPQPLPAWSLSGMPALSWQLYIFGSQHYSLYLSLCSLLWRGKSGEQSVLPFFPVPGGPGSHGGQGRGDAEHWVWQNKPQRCLFAGGGSKRRTNPVSVPRLISQINLHLSTTQEGQGGSLLQHLGKKWLFYQAEQGRALFCIVFLWMLGESEGGTLGRKGQQQLPALRGLLVRLGFGFVSSQTLTSKAGTSCSPALFSHSLTHSPREIWALRPCPSISLPTCSRGITSPGFCRVHALRHQVSSPVSSL